MNMNEGLPPRDGYMMMKEEHELIGKTKEEVITLLGSPAETEYFKEEDNVYYLGAERGIISIDSEWLVIWFDGNEQAVKFELRTD